MEKLGVSDGLWGGRAGWRGGMREQGEEGREAGGEEVGGPGAWRRREGSGAGRGQGGTWAAARAPCSAFLVRCHFVSVSLSSFS